MEDVFVRPATKKSALGAAASSSSLVKRFKVDNIIERLEKAERINARLEVKEKEKKFKLSKSGCEKQFKFNVKMKDMFGDDLKVELQKHFKEGLPEKVGGLVKEAEKEIVDQNLRLKIADEFGYKAMEDFIKEDLARDDKEEKKIKALRKEKKEREEKGRGKAGLRGFGFRGFDAKDKDLARGEASTGGGSGRRRTASRARRASGASTARVWGTWPGTASSRRRGGGAGNRCSR